MLIQYVVEKNQITIYDYLLEKQFSKKLISALKYQGGEIFVHNEPKFVNHILNKGDCLTIKLPKEAINDDVVKTKMVLDIVFEDEYFLIINKETGVPTIPSKRHFENSLANGLQYYYDINHIDSGIHFVNRLDKDTSGLVVVAKNRFIHHLFDHYVEMEKKYLALVTGMVNASRVIEANIKRETEEGVRRIVASDGEYAKTTMNPLGTNQTYSLVELTLATGRTHQIRVHMAFLNHPILGDALYGGNMDFIIRQALHSYYLKFYHPITNELLEIRCMPPLDMESLIDKL